MVICSSNTMKQAIGGLSPSQALMLALGLLQYYLCKLGVGLQWCRREIITGMQLKILPI